MLICRVEDDGMNAVIMLCDILQTLNSTLKLVSIDNEIHLLDGIQVDSGLNHQAGSVRGSVVLPTAYVHIEVRYPRIFIPPTCLLLMCYRK